MRNILVKPDLRKFSKKNSCVFSPQLLDSLLSLVELVMCGNSTQSHGWAAFYWSPNVWLIFSFDFGASPNQFVCGYKRKWVQRCCSPSVRPPLLVKAFVKSRCEPLWKWKNWIILFYIFGYLLKPKYRKPCYCLLVFFNHILSN